MNVKVLGTRERGSHEKERVVLSVTDTADLSEYVLLAVGLTKVGFDSKILDGFWFPRAELERGDLVVLYTKVGTDKVRENSSGNKTHFFYWKRDSTRWHASDTAVLLAHSSERTLYRIAEEEE